MARVAEQAERFNDMVDFLTPVLDNSGNDLSGDERNLLSVAFKNLISSQRSAWRTISAIEQNPKYTKHADGLGQYKRKIEGILIGNCDKVIGLVTDKVLSKECPNEARAFFDKMVGDYYRYISEVASGAKLDEVKQNALEAYNNASKHELSPCNSIKLGLALNFSVFHYEVMKDPKMAIKLAEEAL